MLSDKELLNQLNDMLDDVIDTNLKNQGKSACDKELQRLRGTFNQFSSELSPDLQQLFASRADRLNDIVHTLEDLMICIDTFARAQETELQGVQNFSAYEEKRVQQCAYKVVLKNKLEEMLQLIYDERPNLRSR